MRYNLNCRALLALIPMTADPKTNRPILTGIHFETNGQGVATDGHVLGVYREAVVPQSVEMDNGDTASYPLISFTLWGDFRAIKSALRKAVNKRGESAPAVLDVDSLDMLHTDNDRVAYRCPASLTVFPVKGPAVTFAVEVSPQGTDEWETCYPNWMPIIPPPGSYASVQEIRVNPDLLALFGSSARVTFTGDKTAIIVNTPDPDFFGLMMPLRLEGRGCQVEPDWLRDIHGNLTRAAA